MNMNAVADDPRHVLVLEDGAREPGARCAIGVIRLKR
jgi:hypothetical protein